MAIHCRAVKNSLRGTPPHFFFIFLFFHSLVSQFLAQYPFTVILHSSLPPSLYTFPLSPFILLHLPYFSFSSTVPFLHSYSHQPFVPRTFPPHFSSLIILHQFLQYRFLLLYTTLHINRRTHPLPPPVLHNSLHLRYFSSQREFCAVFQYLCFN